MGLLPSTSVRDIAKTWSDTSALPAFFPALRARGGAKPPGWASSCLARIWRFCCLACACSGIRMFAVRKKINPTTTASLCVSDFDQHVFSILPRIGDHKAQPYDGKLQYRFGDKLLKL